MVKTAGTKILTDSICAYMEKMYQYNFWEAQKKMWKSKECMEG